MRLDDIIDYSNATVIAGRIARGMVGQPRVRVAHAPCFPHLPNTAALAMEAVSNDDGFAMLHGSELRPGRIEEVSATLALAIACHQLGQHEDAQRLLRGAARYTSTLSRSASEATFWWLAAGAYGVFGTAEGVARVNIDGEGRDFDLSAGVQVGTVPPTAPVHDLFVSVVFQAVKGMASSAQRPLSWAYLKAELMVPPPQPPSEYLLLAVQAKSCCSLSDGGPWLGSAPLATNSIPSSAPVAEKAQPPPYGP